MITFAKGGDLCRSLYYLVIEPVMPARNEQAFFFAYILASVLRLFLTETICLCLIVLTRIVVSVIISVLTRNMKKTDISYSYLSIVSVNELQGSRVRRCAA
jgi:hypothetical protein